MVYITNKLKEVLKVATTYSFLNGIQTALYKITPYSLRKNTQTAIISYFYGDLPYTKLITHLESSNKLKTLLELCKDKQAKALREGKLGVMDYYNMKDILLQLRNKVVMTT